MAWSGAVQPSASTLTTPYFISAATYTKKLQHIYNLQISFKHKNAYTATRNNCLVVQSFYNNILFTVIYKTPIFRPRWYHTKLGKGHRLFHISEPRKTISLIRFTGSPSQNRCFTYKTEIRYIAEHIKNLQNVCSSPSCRR